MPDPIIEKAAGDNIPFVHDWTKDLARLGDALITESHWNVDVGSIVIGSDGRVSFIAGPITGCFVQGGTPDEYCVLNNSILLNKAVDPDSGDKLVRRFIVHILDGQWEPMTPPVVILPDGLPDITTLEAFRGATPGVSIWVDVTPSYPAGDLYYAVPDSFTGAAVDGNTVVQGQLVKWVSIHSIGSFTGVLPARRIDTTSPLAGGGDLSANRTHALTVGPANQLITSDGSTVAWRAMTDAIHGNRGGDSLHVMVDYTHAGFVPTIATSGGTGLLITADGATASWATSIGDPYIYNLSFSKLFGLPSITTTAPLTGGGTLGNLTLGISFSGTTNHLAKYTPTGASIGNSVFVDDGTFAYVVRNGTGAADSPLDWSQFSIRGATDPTLRLSLAFDTSRNVGFIQAGKSGTGELPISINPKGSSVGFGTSNPQYPLHLSSDSTASASPLDYSQFMLTGKADSTKRLGIQFDTTGNRVRIAAGQSGVGTYPIELLSNVGFGVTSPSATVDTSTFRMRTGASIDYLMKSGSDGSAAWTSISGLGLMRNGDAHIYLADFLTLSSIGDYDIDGGTLGYETQATTTHGKSLNIRAQSSTVDYGGNVNIFSGIGVTPSVDGVINLTAGSSGSGTINLAGGRVTGPSGWFARSPVASSDSVVPQEDVKWDAIDTTGNGQGTIFFTGLNGASVIGGGSYSFIYTIVARGTRFNGTIIYAATWVKSGGLTKIENYSVANPNSIALDTSSPGSNAIALLITPPGSSGSDIVRWVIKTQIIKY